ncbi:MAG: rhamnulokinase family protein [Planctomycetota bacterium]
MSQQAHIAIDLGAESGRVIVGTLAGDRLTMHETHRFRHLPAPTPTGLCWNITDLWRQILDGLRLAQAYMDEHDIDAVSVGVDTWAVDFTTISPAGSMLGLPRAYRDPAFEEAFARVTQKITPREIYDATGIQLMALNSLFQYESRVAQDPGLFADENTLMFIPDVLHWLLCGQISVERTNASTSQMVDVRTGDWNHELLNKLGLPTGCLQTPVDPGSSIGTLRDEVADATGLPASVQVVLPPSHDTASAIAAVPADPQTNWCYLSSGTWSLLGAELDTPCINDAAAEANFTNELGVSGTTRFLKNISGLWLVQEVRRQLEREGQVLDYAELTEQAAGAEPLRTLIPVNDPCFTRPGDIIPRIQGYAKQTGQPVPESVGALVRCCLESLAMEYRNVLQILEGILGRKFDVLHIVGGGGKNGLLNRMTCHAIGIPVVVGPEEATAMGNLLTQAMGTGRLADLDAIRGVVRSSIASQRIEPDGNDAWAEPFARYLSLPTADADL